jgi:hypothetical protein
MNTRARFVTSAGRHGQILRCGAASTARVRRQADADQAVTEIRMARDIESRRHAIPARSLVALAAGAVAAGVLAVGAVAIGQMVIGRLAIGKARFKSLEVDELTVRKLRVIERHDPGS